MYVTYVSYILTLGWDQEMQFFYAKSAKVGGKVITKKSSMFDWLWLHEKHKLSFQIWPGGSLQDYDTLGILNMQATN